MHGLLRVIVLLAPAITLPCDCFVLFPVKSGPLVSLAAAASHDDGAASCASSVAAGKPILCKTVETFKLADLYHLELSIKASLYGMSCQRLGIDPATGSSLLLLSDQARDGLDQEEPRERGTFAHTNCDHLLTISKSQSVEWIGLELASAGDVEGLVDVLRKKADEVEMMMRDQVGTSANGPQDLTWTLEYTRVGNIIGGDKDRPRHTSKTICYGVANALKLPPELDAQSDSASSLVLLDGPDKIRLCLVMSGGKSDTKSNGATDNVQKKWPGRPFQYSSAMNPTAASIIIDILLRMCEKDMDKTPTLLDPTCGSGTFLAFAVGNGANAIGWDIKESCCEGTRRNLDYLKTTLFVGEGMEPSSSQQLAYRIDNQDAAQVSIDALGGDEIDCVVANLPWGQNTPTYYEENEKILKALRGILRSDAVPVAIISRDSSVQNELERIGFRVLGAASIPQSNFRLPKTSKKTKKRKEVADDDGNTNDDQEDRGGSICMVTIAVTDQSKDESLRTFRFAV